MKINELKTLGLSHKGMEEIDVDHVQAIVHDEFVRPEPHGARTDYRGRGIDRILKNNLSLYNNCNITFDLLKRYVTITCPYCALKMKYTSGGGNGNTSSGDYHCQCGASAHISLDNNGALGFTPKEKK